MSLTIYGECTPNTTKKSPPPLQKFEPSISLNSSEASRGVADKSFQIFVGKKKYMESFNLFNF